VADVRMKEAKRRLSLFDEEAEHDWVVGHLGAHA
jgi:hypothetical protein